MNSSISIHLDPISLAILDLSELSPSEFLINRINVPKKYRGLGYGTKMLKEVCDHADQEGLTLFLEVNSYGDIDRDQLIQWYRRYGFIKHPEGYMVRNPGNTS